MLDNIVIITIIITMSGEVPKSSEAASTAISDEEFADMLRWQGFMSERMIEVKVAETTQGERLKWKQYLEEKGYPGPSVS